MAKSDQNREMSAHAYATWALRKEIESKKRPPGARLPSLRALAQRFDTSVFPMQTAIATLEREGFVERRHGSGVYVRDRDYPLKMTDSALLLMQATSHVYGNLMQRILHQLHDMGMFAAILDMTHGGSTELTHRALHSKARFILLHAGMHFQFDTLDPRRFPRSELIAVVDWQSERLLDRVHRILADFAAGSRLLVEHLWKAGHRRVLLAGPHTMLLSSAKWDGNGRCPPILNVQGVGFGALWTRRGGHVVTQEVQHESPSVTAALDERIPALLAGAGAPTAVAGFRDIDAWDVREAIRRVRPEALPGLTFVGNGDTPWSQTSYPPFSTLDWNLDKIATLACGIIRDIEAGKTFRKPVVRLIPPRLVVR